MFDIVVVENRKDMRNKSLGFDKKKEIEGKNQNWANKIMLYILDWLASLCELDLYLRNVLGEDNMLSHKSRR